MRPSGRVQAKALPHREPALRFARSEYMAGYRLNW